MNEPNPANHGSYDGAGDQKLLTIDEAATILRTPVATLRYWRWQGSGPRSFRLGRRVLYRYDDLITWINDQHDHDGPHAA